MILVLNTGKPDEKLKTRNNQLNFCVKLTTKTYLCNKLATSLTKLFLGKFQYKILIMRLYLAKLAILYMTINEIITPIQERK
ncbi:hypothetical protein HNP25_001898 [Arcicella rosea]|uniref:Uncharacterized protein n=1 Tax=Arcicella rosea TaxID=502909 RepID=A0A841EJ99_9BACT|nr:hypothetical protein [Arcicella rosea]